jgi:hypothetical protein
MWSKGIEPSLRRFSVILIILSFSAILLGTYGYPNIKDVPLNAVAWGYNGDGQLGRGYTSLFGGVDFVRVPTPQMTLEPTAFKKVAVGSESVLALDARNGKLYYWGSNRKYQLYGAFPDHSQPETNHLSYPALYNFASGVEPSFLGATNNGIAYVVENVVYSTVMDDPATVQVNPFIGTFIAGDCGPRYCAIMTMQGNGHARLLAVDVGVAGAFVLTQDMTEMSGFVANWTSFSAKIESFSEVTLIGTDGQDVWVHSSFEDLPVKYSITHGACNPFCLVSDREWAPHRITKVKLCGDWLFMLAYNGSIFQHVSSTFSSDVNRFLETGNLNNYFPELHAVDFACAANTLLVANLEASTGSSAPQMQHVISWPLATFHHNALLGHNVLKTDIESLIQNPVFYNVSKFKSQNITFADSHFESLAVVAMVDMDSFVWNEETYSAIAWGQDDLGQLMNGNSFAAMDLSHFTYIANEWPEYFPINETTCSAVGSVYQSSIPCRGSYVRYAGKTRILEDSFPLSTVFAQPWVETVEDSNVDDQMWAYSQDGIIIAIRAQGSDEHQLYAVSQSVPELNVFATGATFQGIIESLKCGDRHCGFRDDANRFWSFGANDSNQLFGNSFDLDGVHYLYDSGFDVTHDDHYALGNGFSALWRNEADVFTLIGGVGAATPTAHFHSNQVGTVAKVAASDILVLLVQLDGFHQLFEWSSASSTRDLDDLINLQLDNVVDVAAVGRIGYALVRVPGGSSSVWTWGFSPTLLSNIYSSFTDPPRTPRAISMPRPDIVPTSLCAGCRGNTMIVLTEPFAEQYRPHSLPNAPAPGQGAYRTCFGRNDMGQCGVEGNMNLKTMATHFSNLVPVTAASIGQKVFVADSFGQLYSFGTLVNSQRPFDTFLMDQLLGLDASNASNPQAAVGIDGVPVPIIGVDNVKILAATASSLLMVNRTHPWVIHSMDVISEDSFLPLEILGKRISKIFTPLNPLWSSQWTAIFEGGGFFTSDGSPWNPLDEDTSNLTHVQYGSRWAAIFWTDSTGEKHARGVGDFLDLGDGIIHNADQIAGGADHLVYLEDGKVKTCSRGNSYGQLGSEDYFPFGTLLLANVSFDAALGAPQRIYSGEFTVYVLFDSGSIAVWGHNGPFNLFGFSYPVERSIVPISVPWAPSPDHPIEKAIDLLVFAETVHVILERLTSIIPFPPSSSCGPPPSLPNFQCIGGIWVLVGNVANPSGVVTIGSPTLIVGNVSLGQIEFTYPETPSEGFILTIQGCANFEGLIEIKVTEEQLKEIERKGSSVLDLIAADCGSSSAKIKATADKGCRKAKVTQATTSTPQGGFTLSATFKVDASACNRWWIILVSVLGGIVLFIVVVVLLATLTPLKNVIRPFAKRSAS